MTPSSRADLASFLPFSAPCARTLSGARHLLRPPPLLPPLPPPSPPSSHPLSPAVPAIFRQERLLCSSTKKPVVQPLNPAVTMFLNSSFDPHPAILSVCWSRGSSQHRKAYGTPFAAPSSVNVPSSRQHSAACCAVPFRGAEYALGTINLPKCGRIDLFVKFCHDEWI